MEGAHTVRIPPYTKLEKVVSKDQSRPVLTRLYLRITGEGDERQGWLEGTDSYKLLRLPVDIDEDDTEGFIPIDAITTARKLKADTMACNGSVRVVGADGVTAEYDRPADGQWVNADSLLDVEPAQIDGYRWKIGLSPLLLLDLAMGMGAETVTLEFTATRPAPGPDGGNVSFAPSNLRPIQVRPQNMLRGADRNDDTIGLLMPVRS